MPYELDAAQALQLHQRFTSALFTPHVENANFTLCRACQQILYKSHDGRVLTSRSEHHRERVAKRLDASWI